MLSFLYFLCCENECKLGLTFEAEVHGDIFVRMTKAVF